MEKQLTTTTKALVYVDMSVCCYSATLPCCCVMFLLRMGVEGRSHSSLPLQLAKLLERCGCGGCGWGGTEAGDGAVAGEIGVRRLGLGWRKTGQRLL